MATAEELKKKTLNNVNRLNTNTQTQPSVQTVSQQPRTYDQQIRDLTNRMYETISRPQQQFQYDPYSDPQYQQALAQAQRNAQQGTSQVMAEMNRRGILNSTITGDRANEITNREMANVQTQIMPQLMNQAYQRYLNDQAQQQQQFRNIAAMAQMLADNDYRQQRLALDEGQLTGSYLPQNVRQLIDEAMTNKSNWGSSAPEVQRQLADRNQEIYRQLAQMGYDPSGMNQNVGVEDALRYISNMSATLPAQQMQYSQQADQRDFDYRQGIDQRNFDYQLSRDQIGDQRYADETAYRREIDRLERERRAQEFAQQMGYNWAQLTQRQKEAMADQALRRDQLEFQRQQATNQAASSQATQRNDLSAKDYAANYLELREGLRNYIDPQTKRPLTQQEMMIVLEENRDVLSDSDYRKLLEAIYNGELTQNDDLNF